MLEALKGSLLGHRPSEYVKGELSAAALELHSAVRSFEIGFRDAMDDDFNTASAIGLVFELVREINRVATDLELLQNDPRIKDGLSFAMSALTEAAGVLNLFKRDPDDWFGRTGKAIELKATDSEMALLLEGFGELGYRLSDGVISTDQIEGLIKDRKDARLNKDWKKADRVRDMLAKAGIELLDGPEGTKWQTIKE
jgi:cysteinyl-tRNA synthetase